MTEEERIQLKTLLEKAQNMVAFSEQIIVTGDLRLIGLSHRIDCGVKFVTEELTVNGELKHSEINI